MTFSIISNRFSPRAYCFLDLTFVRSYFSVEKETGKNKKERYLGSSFFILIQIIQACVIVKTVLEQDNISPGQFVFKEDFKVSSGRKELKLVKMICRGRGRGRRVKRNVKKKKKRKRGI